MPKEDWIKNPVHEILRRHKKWPFTPPDIDEILDVGCGLSLKSQYLSKDCYIPEYGFPSIVGVDIHEPYLRAIDTTSAYTVVKADVRFLDKIFIEDSFDIVYALDIIEHLHKGESIKLIEDCKRIAKKAVVIETPNGFSPQNIDIQGYGADQWQTHRCGWELEELEELGFDCVATPYQMDDVKRHTELKVNPNIVIIDAIWLK